VSVELNDDEFTVEVIDAENFQARTSAMFDHSYYTLIGLERDIKV